MTDDPNAPHAYAPRWGTWEEFVAWFMKQPDDRVFDGIGDKNGIGRCETCVIASWLKDLNNGCRIHYGGYDSMCDPSWGRPIVWKYTKETRFKDIAAIADRNKHMTKKELLDILPLS